MKVDRFVNEWIEVHCLVEISQMAYFLLLILILKCDF